MSRNVRVKRSLFGGYRVHFGCPRCQERLKSDLKDAGGTGVCPTCGQQFIVPGSEDEVPQHLGNEREREEHHNASDETIDLHRFGRAMAMKEKLSQSLRTHLNLLLEEGCITSIQAERIAREHPLTISDTPLHDLHVRKDIEASDEIVTYYEAHDQLVRGLCGLLMPWEKCLREMDPLNIAGFRADDQETLSKEVVIGTHFVRNQSLYTIFPSEDQALKIEGTCSNVLPQLFDKQSADLYGLFKKEWIMSISGYDLPHLAVADVIISRSRHRTGHRTKELLDEFLRLGVGEVLLYKNIGCWHRIAGGFKLIPG